MLIISSGLALPCAAQTAKLLPVQVRQDNATPKKTATTGGKTIPAATKMTGAQHPPQYSLVGQNQ